MAVKSLKEKDGLSNSQVKEEFDKETEILKLLNHPNIVQIFGYIMKEQSYQMVLEFCPNGDLKTFLKKEAGKGSDSTVDFDMLIKICADVSVGNHIFKKIPGFEGMRINPHLETFLSDFIHTDPFIILGSQNLRL